MTEILCFFGFKRAGNITWYRYFESQHLQFHFHLRCKYFSFISFIVNSNSYLWMIEQVSNDQKGRLLMSTERLNHSTDRLKDSRRTMLETEELGVSILQDLHLQRQSLLHAHTTVSFTTCMFLIPLGNILATFSSKMI